MMLIIAAFLFLSPSSTWAQDSTSAKPPTIKAPVDSLEAPKKGGLNTDLFEKENVEKIDEDEGLKTLTAKVKVVREESDGVEVFFEGDKNTGTFFLHRAIPQYAKILKWLEESKKPQGATVTISYAEDKKIKKVHLNKDASKTVPTDPNAKWDLSL